MVVGQDPYHNHNQAHGLAFSVRPPTPAPPSLANIYTGIKNDYPSFIAPPNKGGLLIPWAERGVLLLNTCLTVRAHQPASHSNKGWERLTQKAIDVVTRVRTRGVVFLAWGTPAGKRLTGVNRERHCILQSVHPSPLSAHRGFVSIQSISPQEATIQFLIRVQFHNQHFKKCNDWLAGRYGPDETIDWSLVPRKDIPTGHLTTFQNSSVVVNHSSEDDQTRSTSTKNLYATTLSNHPVDEDDEFEDLDALEALATSEGAKP